MRRFLLVIIFTSFIATGFTQTTVFSDNFNTSTGASYTIVSGSIGSSSVWSMGLSGPDWGAKIDGNILDLTNDGSAAGNVNGWIYANTPTTSFLPPYNTTLGSNTSLVTWTFNMRQIRADPSGFTSGNYGVAFLLGNGSGNGYAVMLGQTGATDPIRLTRYTGAISSGTITNIITSNTSGLTDFGAEYLSIKVTYDPATNTWELFVRNDGTTAFADPTTGTLTSQGTAVDNTHTGISLTTMGGYWQGSTGTNQTAYFDNVQVVVGVPPTITTGTVTSPPFVLANCASTAAGTVDFTSAGTFNAGNTFTAQLSNDIGSFATPVSIGSISLSGVNPGGTINITIPAGTAGGTGYLIRVVSSDPAATGTSSSSFTITQNGVGGCSSSNTDYYRSVQSGNWWTANTWQSSPDNTNWITATQPPNFNANTILIQSSHTVSIDAASSADQLTIQNGAILDLITGGSLTVNDGSGDDITIASGGMFILSAAGVPPTFSGSSICVVSTGATLRVAATGMTGAGTGVNVNNFVYQHQSVLEYTPTAAFSTGGVTFFPNAGAGTIPIFRANNSGAITVGAGTFTTVNGLFESAGAGVSWQSAGTKTFRNGITGSGDMIALGTSGTFVINGTTASLGGTGALTAPTTGIQVGTTSTVTMTSDKTVTGDISILADSYIDLGVYDLTVTGSITIAGITSYVRTTSTGALTLNNVGSGLSGKLFPVGNSAINPLFISSASTANYSARVVEPITPGIANSAYAVLRTWYLTSSVSTPGAVISFGYSFAGDCGASYINAGPVEVGVNISSTWNVHQTGLVPVAFPLVAGTFAVTTTAPVNYFTTGGPELPFVIGNNGAVLPLDYFITARSQKVNNNAAISWDVFSTDNVLNFEVQRSVSGAAFQTIATVNPAGGLHYSYTDANIEKGTILYRIRVNRLTGGARYSNTVAIINDTKGLLITSVVPNPVQQHAVITLSAARPGGVTFEVYNMSGQKVKHWVSNISEGTNTIHAGFTDLPSGIYHIQAQSLDTRTVLRFIKQ